MAHFHFDINRLTFCFSKPPFCVLKEKQKDTADEVHPSSVWYRAKDTLCVTVLVDTWCAYKKSKLSLGFNFVTVVSTLHFI